MKPFILSLCLLAVANFGISQGKHSTSFDPTKDGFEFVNSFTNNFFDQAGIKITTGGLCGGMSYSALDYYLNKMTIPKQNWIPADHSMLYDYIYKRQVTSLTENIDKWSELLVNPFGARTNEFFNWGLQSTNGGRLQELKSFIDRGIPVPLGLFAEGNGGTGPHHQVLAIGYDCGRYQGKLGPYQEDFKIFCYNPNYPNEITTLVPNPGQHYYYWKEYPNDAHYTTYFVDKKYFRQTPPPDPTLPGGLTDCKVHELVITFGTGGDDLRGGDDNCNVVINFTDGSSQQFLNVNNGARWIDNTSITVELFLDNPVPQNLLKNVEIFTKHCSGISCDNWNLNNLTVIAKGGFPDNPILDLSGNPLLYRFTGSAFSQTYNFVNLQSCNTGVVTPLPGVSGTNELLATITTGSDDLRGDDNLTLHFKDNSTQVFNSVNARTNWGNNSTHTVALNLNKTLDPQEITSMDLQINACRGIGCDNWNFQGISIRAEGENLDKVIYSRVGNPIFRFTGTNNKFTLVLNH